MVGSAIQLDGSTSDVKMPANLFSGISDFSFALWIKQNTSRNWAQLVDFGDDTRTYLTLISNAAPTQRLRFSLKVNGGAEQIVDGNVGPGGSAPLPVGSWQHVAVTRAGTLVSIYLNGVVIGSGTVTGNLPNGGATRNNWLGRSQWPDPLVDGALDDVRLYTRALSAAEIGDLMR